jgi:hypothetical protein
MQLFWVHGAPCGPRALTSMAKLGRPRTFHGLHAECFRRSDRHWVCGRTDRYTVLGMESGTSGWTGRINEECGVHLAFGGIFCNFISLFALAWRVWRAQHRRWRVGGMLGCIRERTWTHGVGADEAFTAGIWARATLRDCLRGPVVVPVPSGSKRWSMWRDGSVQDSG